MEVKLLVTEGLAKGRIIPLPPTVFTIGRAGRCHLRPHSLSVSKFHCAIARWAGKVVVRDLHSANGTFLNAQRVQGEVRVQDGDKLTVGPLEFVFQIKIDPAADRPVPVVREAELKWLMDSADVPPARDASDTHPAATEPPAAAAQPLPGDSGSLSAGAYLRDYFRNAKP